MVEAFVRNRHGSRDPGNRPSHRLMQRLRLIIGFLCGVSMWHRNRDQTAGIIRLARKADERFYCWLRAGQPRSAKGNEMVHQFSVDDKKRRTRDGHRAGRWYILIATIPDDVQRYKNRGYGNKTTLRTENRRSSKQNGGHSISQISRAKGREKFVQAASCQVPVQEQAIRGRR